MDPAPKPEAPVAVSAASSPELINPETQADFGMLAKVVAIAAAIAYPTGVLTSNIYLHALGITDFSFAKPKLILTGVVVLFSFVMLAPLPIFLARGRTRVHHWGELESSTSLKMLLLLVCPLLVLLAASAFLNFRKASESKELELTFSFLWNHFISCNGIGRKILGTLFIAAAVYVPIWLAAWFGYKSVRLSVHARSARRTSRLAASQIYFPVALAFALLCALAYIYFFSITFFAVIPAAFGGGKPYYESLLIGDDNVKQVQQLGIPFVEGETNVTKPVRVLHESDAIMAVWLQKKETGSAGNNTAAGDRIIIQLNKSLIAGTKIDLDRKFKLTPPSPGVAQ